MEILDSLAAIDKQLLFCIALFSMAMGLLSAYLMEKHGRHGLQLLLITMILMLAGTVVLALPTSHRSWLQGQPWVFHIPHSIFELEIFRGSLKWLLIPPRAFFGAAVPMLGIPFLIMLYEKWLNGKATEAERRVGWDGIRAWFSRSKLLWAAALAIGLWLRFDVNWLTSTLCLAVLLLLYPIARLALSDDAALPAGKPAKPIPDTGQMTAEREQVLRMVDEGKVTAEEGAELLNALAATHAAVPVRLQFASSIKTSQKIVAAGFVLAFIGFCLPWLRVDLGEELERIISRNSSNSLFDSNAGNDQADDLMDLFHIPNGIDGDRSNDKFRMYGGSSILNLTKVINRKDIISTVDIAGARMSAGWFFLLSAIAVVSLILIPNEINFRTKRKIELFCAVLATLALLYVIMIGTRYLVPGFFLSALGFAIMWIGMIRHWRYDGSGRSYDAMAKESGSY